MRKSLHTFLNRLNDPNVYLIHCDLWKWDNTRYNNINCGVQEPNMVNIAAGLASQGKTVFVYGVCGYVLYKCYEQMKLNVRGFGDQKGSVIFVNAGHNGAYAYQGKGHVVPEDADLCTLLHIPVYTPPDRSTFIKYVKEAIREPKGTRLIRLGWDNEVWKKSL